MTAAVEGFVRNADPNPASHRIPRSTQHDVFQALDPRQPRAVHPTHGFPRRLLQLLPHLPAARHEDTAQDLHSKDRCHPRMACAGRVDQLKFSQ